MALRRNRLAEVLGAWAVLAAVGVMVGLLPAAHAAFGAQTADEPGRALALKYAPVVVVRQHPAPCGAGEPYLPSSVERVLGRSDVVLHTPSRDVTAPTPSELFRAPQGSNLDLAGQVLDPGCDYETWAGRIGANVQPTVYARVVTEPGHSGVVALQYWFWWVYNDWNDRHEGDWEMVQLVFDADDAAGALSVDPRLTAYAQHEGAELADWQDHDKLALADGHPVVYPGRGSHAAYYTQAVWFGRSASTGFGCDDTSAPGTAVHPAVEVLPTAVPTSADAPYAWLAYPGRWGERAPSFNNGPTGPATKEQWSAPITWVEEHGRPGSVALPPVPGAASDGYCRLVTAGSGLFLLVLRSPPTAAFAALASAALVVVLYRRTRWRGGSPEPDAERHTGQIIVDQFRVAVRMWRHLLPASALLFLLALAGAFARQWAVSPGVDTSITQVRGTQYSLGPVIATAAAILLLLVVQSGVVGVVVNLLAQRATRERVSFRAALRRLLRNPLPSMLYLAGSVLLSLLFSTFWLVPVALLLLSVYAVCFVASAVEGTGARDSLARSRRLTRTRRAKSAMLALVLLLLAAASGPTVGGLLLLVTGWPVAMVNVIAALVTAVLVPVPTIGIGLLFYDLRHEEAQATRAASVSPAPPTVARD